MFIINILKQDFSINSINILIKYFKSRILGKYKLLFLSAIYENNKSHHNDFVKFTFITNIQEYNKFLKHHPNESSKIFNSFKDCILNNGYICIGVHEDSIISYGFIKPAGTIEKYFFPLPENSVVIYDCHVGDNFRGQGIYPLMLIAIKDFLYNINKTYAFISCWDFNIPSKKGIKKAGFSFFGYGAHGSIFNIFNKNKKYIWEQRGKTNYFIKNKKNNLQQKTSK